MMADFTVVSANVHSERAAVRYLATRSRADALEHFDVGLISEAHKRTADLRKLPGHDYYTGPKNGGVPEPHAPDRMWKNLAQDCGVLVNNAETRGTPLFASLGGGCDFLSPADPGSPQIGHQRWGLTRVTRLDDRHDTELAFIAMHPIAQPTGPERRERYVMAVRWLDAEITKHRDLGREVVPGGDWQVREHDKGLHSPRHVLANHDMDWHWHGIDVLAWTPGLEKVGRAGVVPKGEWPSDHPLLRVKLSVKPRRSR